ncbi:MAG TPA: UDP-N-acetylmuramoyl-L-alanyl-D-glutamate--2,6-diaminopimelate ligase [Polyangiales bacterium]|nr:UDP-N-acetylmuramoyl-L-alanyl-D-glutamate--2,6-diaminopimelate ligase [Polyangiales bacterium]
MAELSLAELATRGFALRVLGDGGVRVRGIKHDSRRCEAGDLFVAVAGASSDGADHIADAVKRGAVAILAERPLPAASVPVLLAKDALLSLARIARELYDDPSAPLTVVGVTGTNGKTTITYLVEALLQADGEKPAVIGTVNFRGPGGILPATHTTPMADDMMRLCRWAVDTGASHLVLEVSSHALAMYRADGVHFDVAAFTNLTQDHLDYHGDFAHYEAAKRRLFTDLAPRWSVINVDDPRGRALADSLAGRVAPDGRDPSDDYRSPALRGGSPQVLRCSKRPGGGAQVSALTYVSDRNGIAAEVDTPQGIVNLKSPLIGEHNLENLLIAIGCGLALGIAPDVLQSALTKAQGAPGRLERVEHPEDVLVFVDYAHTPDGLRKVLAALRPNTQGRLIALFGAGGDRDPTKRPVMGQVAAELADVLVLTSDNPRSEAPEKILEAIEAGVQATGCPKLTAAELHAAKRGYVSLPDRRAAIRLAVSAAQAGDTLLLAGKGHEKVQIIGDKRLPFDDVVEARAAIGGA